MHSEGEVCSEIDKEEIEKVVPLLNCTCQEPQEQEPNRKINVVKILGEGSQGTVALCHYEDLKTKTSKYAANQTEGRESLAEDVFVVKVFEHVRRGNEGNEVQSVRLQNIENE